MKEMCAWEDLGKRIAESEIPILDIVVDSLSLVDVSASLRGCSDKSEDAELSHCGWATASLTQVSFAS